MPTLYISTLKGDGSVVETDKDVMDILLVTRVMNLPKCDLKNYESTEEPFNVSSVSKEVKSQTFPLIISVLFSTFSIDIIVSDFDFCEGTIILFYIGGKLGRLAWFNNGSKWVGPIYNEP